MGFSRRILSSLTVVSALFLSLPAISDARALRQHVESRSSLDVCATIDESTFPWVNLYLPSYNYQSCVNICLCISTLPTAIQTNSDLERLAKEYGEDKVKSDLTLLVSFAPSVEVAGPSSSPPRVPDQFRPEQGGMLLS